MGAKEDLTLNSEKVIHLAEHEILLSFNNDSGAVKFHDWWYEQGSAAFDKFCEEYELD